LSTERFISRIRLKSVGQVSRLETWAKADAATPREKSLGF
jgi:hypothetical protein